MVGGREGGGGFTVLVLVEDVDCFDSAHAGCACDISKGSKESQCPMTFLFMHSTRETTICN